MNRTLRAAAFSVLMALSVAAANAQDVFVLPASSGSANTSAFGVNPFAPAGTGTFAVDSAAYTVLATADGSKFYVIAKDGTDTVEAFDSTFSNLRFSVSLGGAATAAILSPDRTRLVVGTNAQSGSSVFIFNTSTDAYTGLNVGGAVIDLAANLDSTRAFALVNTGTGSQLVAIDLSTNSAIGTAFALPGSAFGVSTGPNDLLYVSRQNQVMVVDPRNPTTALQQISLSGLPGKMLFTPDGTLGLAPLAPNQSASGGPTLWAVNIATNALSFTIPVSSVQGSASLNSLYIVSSNQALALSSANTLLNITPLSSLFTVNPFAYASGSVSAVALSADLGIAGSSHLSTQYLFFLTSGTGTTLNRFDFTQTHLSQAALTYSGGALAVAGAAIAGTPANLLVYGNNQSVSLGAVSLPLVVRVTDSNGNPLAGVPVSFSTTATGAAIQNPSVNTSSDGFALTSVTVPNLAGAFNVLASAGSKTATFTLNVGTVPSSAGGLSIVSGQGLLVQEDSNTQATNNHITVALTDTAGHPVSGTSVKFAITSGSGTLVVSGIGNGTSINVTTDSNGHASVDFLASTGFSANTIVASTSTSSVTFFVTTYASASPPTVAFTKPQVGVTLSGQAGQTLTSAVVAQVTSSTGPAIPNISLQLMSPSGSSVTPAASCSSGVALTDSTGIVKCDLVLGSKVGASQVIASVGGGFSNLTIPVTITAGPPATMTIEQGNNQTGNAGDTLPLALVVQVSDAFGNVLSGAAVTWTVTTPNGGTLVNVYGTTDSIGRASAQLKLGNVSGTVNVSATSGSATASFSETVNAGVANVQIVSGNNQTAIISSSFGSPLVVKVVDAQGNPVAGQQVAFAVTAGSALLATPTATTDATGQASTMVLAGSSAGAITVTATVSGVSVTFNLASLLPGPQNIQFLNAASFRSNTYVNTAFQPSAISPGSLAIITGTGIAPGVQGIVTAFSIVGPLPTSLAGVSVTFNNTPAPIYYVSNSNGQEQVAVQVPFEVQPGNNVSVTVNAAEGGSATVTTTVLAYSPGTFLTVVGDQTIVVAQRPDGSYVSPTNPAQRGENIRVYMTGLGQTTPATATGSAGVPGQQVAAPAIVVGLNNAGTVLVSAEYVPGSVGVYALTIEVPSDTAPGPAQPFGMFMYDSKNNVYWGAGGRIPIQ